MEKVVITEELVRDLVSQSYRIAKGHGFHDDYHSPAHYMMLVLSEIGEMVEADRKNRHTIYSAVEYCDKHIDEIDVVSRNRYFERDVKDTFEDEMADVVIRLCDFCGSLGIIPHMNAIMVDMSDEFRGIFGSMSVCEQCFYLSSMLVDIEKWSHDANDTEMRHHLGSTLSFIFEMAYYYNIDLLWHIARKMEYNEHRPNKHGKAY